MKPKVAIIGGGASSIVAALRLQDTYDVTIFEREKELLLKLLKTGNGKANIFNRAIKLGDYNDEGFMKDHVPKMEQTLDKLFRELGVITYTDEANRVYPFSRSARGLKTYLEHKLTAKVMTDTNVYSVLRHGETYVVNGQTFDYLILATGSSAGLFKRDISNDNDHLLQSLNLGRTPLTPVIKTIHVHENLHAIKHERVDARLTLVVDGHLISANRGEILFKEDGLSGIVSFVLSSYLEWLPHATKNIKMQVDFMPDHSKEEVERIINEDADLTRLFAPRIADFISKHPRKEWAHLIKNYPFTPLRGNYPENAQAFHGGIEVTNITRDFSHKEAPNLYILGEVLNIDGICGGYNLGFAFYSAYVASQSLLDKLSKQ